MDYIMDKTMQQIKEENAVRNRVARGIAEIRIAAIEQHIASYKTGMITAGEFLTMTDNIWQNEINQTLGLGL